MTRSGATLATAIVVAALFTSPLTRAGFVDIRTLPLDDILQEAIDRCDPTTLSTRLRCRADYVERNAYRVNQKEQCDIAKVAGFAKRMAQIHTLWETGKIDAFQREILVKLEKGCKQQ